MATITVNVEEQEIDFVFRKSPGVSVTSYLLCNMDVGQSVLCIVDTINLDTMESETPRLRGFIAVKARYDLYAIAPAWSISPGIDINFEGIEYADRYSCENKLTSVFIAKEESVSE